MMHKKVEGVGGNGSKNRSNSVATTKNISFVPNTAFEWSNLGFLAIDNVLPTDFQLNMVTLLQNVQVGSKITCVLSCQKEFSKAVLDLLHYSVIFNDKLINIERDSSPLEFNFLLRFYGEYVVVVKLYGQHVLGSPLTLPVAASALPGLLKLGLIPHDNGVEGGKSSGSNILEGSECVAKWTEDMVWYRARVDKVKGEMLEVTFYDYGNKEMVARRDVVMTALDIPKGDEGNTVEVCFTDYGNTAEVEIVDIVKTKKDIPTKDEVDENVVETAEGSNGAGVKDCLMVEEKVENDVDESVGTISSGDEGFPVVGSTVVAKWLEDEVWYNAQVESITEEGYSVVFTDYGNSAIVKPGHILKSAQDIPKDDCIDECVAIANGDADSSVPETCRWSEGCVCIAQWSEDNVWYNGVVRSDLGNGQYEVTFTDYGNNAIVAADKIIATASDIPADQVEGYPEPNANGDFHTGAASDVSKQITTADSNIPTDTESTRLSSSPNPPVGIKCIACWSEDNG